MESKFMSVSLVAIVAIVAIITLTVLQTSIGSPFRIADSSSSLNALGAATGPFSNIAQPDSNPQPLLGCFETDGGNYPKIAGRVDALNGLSFKDICHTTGLRSSQGRNVFEGYCGGIDNTIGVRVNGQTVNGISEGNSRTIGGLPIFVQDVFMTSIPTIDASATIFVGQNEYTLQKSQTFNHVQRNGQNLNGSFFALNAISGFNPSLSTVDDFSLQFRPDHMSDKNYLLVGESFTDPLLGVDLTFEGVDPDLNEVERAYTEVIRAGTRYEVSFTNRDGDRYEALPILEEASDNSIRYTQNGSEETRRLVLGQTEAPFYGQLQENDFFFTFEGSISNPISKVYSISSISEENGIKYVDFKDLHSGNILRTEQGEALGSTYLVIDIISTSGDLDVVNFTAATRQYVVNYFVTEGDLKVIFDPIFNVQGGTTNPTLFQNATRNANVNITWRWTEDFNSRYYDEGEDAPRTSWTTLFHGDAGDEDNELFASNLTGGVSGDEDYDDYDYFMTSYGSYIVWETENDGDSYKVWYPQDGEADYIVNMGVHQTMQTIARSGDDLNFGEAFNLGSNLKFDDNDFPELLADGVVDDQDQNDEWEYQQEIRFPTGAYPRVSFGIPPGSSDVDLPQLYVDFNNNPNQPAYTHVTDFDQRANLATLNNGESIEMFGKIFMFDPDNNQSSPTFTLIGAENAVFLELGVPQSIVINGQIYQIELYSASLQGMTVEDQNCELGCQNGQCMSSNTTSCTDSDGGLNYRVQGTARGTNGTTDTDVCLSRLKLREYYCDSRGNIQSQIFGCPSLNASSVCANGRCV